MNLVDGIRNPRWCNTGRQTAALRIEIDGFRDVLCDRRDQTIGPLQVMILKRRLVDLRGKNNFIGAVGLYRVEMFRTLGKRRIQNIGPGIGRRIRVIPNRGAAGGQQQRQCQAPPFA